MNKCWKIELEEIALGHIVNFLLFISFTQYSYNYFFLCREQLKRERIAEVLEQSITTEYQLTARLGRVVYFEHPYINNHTHPLTLTVAWTDPELK